MAPIGFVEIASYFGPTAYRGYHTPAWLEAELKYQHVLRNRSAVSFQLYENNERMDGPRPFVKYYYEYNKSQGLEGRDTEASISRFRSQLDEFGPSRWDECFDGSARHCVTSIPSPRDRQTTSFHYSIDLLLDPQCSAVAKWGKVRSAGVSKAEDPEVRGLAERLNESAVAQGGQCRICAEGIWGEPVYGYAMHRGKLLRTTDLPRLEYPELWERFSFDEKLALALALSKLGVWLPAGIDHRRTPNGDGWEWAVCMKTRAQVEEEAADECAKATEQRRRSQVEAKRQRFIDV